MRRNSSRSAFTLIEIMLFVAIMSIMAGTIIGFSLLSGNIAAWNDATSEVEQNGSIAFRRMYAFLSNTADSIASPLPGESSDTLIFSREDPQTEYVFTLYNNRIAYIENGNLTYLTTGEVLVDHLHFFHYGEPGAGEGVMIVFRVSNAAIGTELGAGQHKKIYRGSATLSSERCASDSDCSDATFGACCDGVCRPNCTDACMSHSDCSGGQICCVSGGSASCKNIGSCNTAQCLTVADCPDVRLSCEESTCTFSVPTCTAGLCDTISIDRCSSCSVCTDGLLDELRDEECDDGNTDNTDSCSSDCEYAVCGDGYLQPNGADGSSGGGDDEECDDGNTMSGDGCSHICENENLCSGGSPDGDDDWGEECDDGNGVDTDVCDNFCRLTLCGDGIVQSPNGWGINEECDETAYCSPGCQNVDQNKCGNGVLESGEECDDGKRCIATGEVCQFDDDCPGETNTCRGFSGDGCSSPFTGFSASKCNREDVCGDGWVSSAELCDDGGVCYGSSLALYEGVDCAELDPSGDLQKGVARCKATGGTCSPLGGDGCSADCAETCFNSLEPCIIDSDCGTCVSASCVEGLCGYVPSSSSSSSSVTSSSSLSIAPEICDNSIDDDLDTAIDCADTSDCPNGTACGDYGMECSGGSCVCSLGQSNESACSDSVDNDCDNYIDCSDLDCDGLSCGANGLTCSSLSCTCPGGSTESSCKDGVDNDCDGDVDCDDFGDCFWQKCGGGNKRCRLPGMCF